MTQNATLSEKKVLLTQLLKEKKTTYSYPLSYGQKALWFIYQQVPESPAYNMARPIEIRGSLNTAVLPSALERLVIRHPILRTTVALEEDEPVQVVHPAGSCQLTEHDAATWSKQELDQALRLSCEQPFDLKNGPVLRVDLFLCGTEHCILLLTMHHLLGDAGSLVILSKELLTLWQGAEKTSLPPLSVSYADFIRAEQAMLSGPRSEELLAFWKNNLQGCATELNLQTDFPRPAVQTYNGASIPYTFSEELSQELKQLAQQEKTTLFNLMLTAFQILLHRYTGQEDILVGTPTAAGRQDARFSEVVGYFVNSVVLRANIDPVAAISFRDLLEVNRRNIMEVLEHAACPFPLLVKNLQPKRDASYSPLFQVMLDFKAADFAPTALPGLLVSSVEMGQMEGQFDLNLSVYEGEQLSGHLNYNRDLFRPETVQRIITHFEVLLTAVVQHFDQPVNQLPLMPEQEISQLMNWNNTDRNYPGKEQTLADLFETQVRKTPDNTALIFGGQQITYSQLNERANQLAHELLARKNDNNPLIAICLERSLEMVIGLLAILKAGCAYVPIDPEYPRERIRYMLEDSAAPVLLTRSHQVDSLPLEELDHTCLILALDTEFPSGQTTADPKVPRTVDDLAYMIYTSGSTGKPKGALNAHSGIVNRLLWMQETYQLTAEDRVLQKTTFSFDVSVWEFFWPLITGAGLVVAKPEGHKDPVYLADLIKEHQVTTLHFVPSMLQTFLTHTDAALCRSLVRVICSGEALTPEHVRQFFNTFGELGTELHNLYGPTEAAIDVSHHPCSPQDADSLSIPIGKPVANTKLYVLDVNRQLVPVGVPGELYIGGVQVGRGYLNRPDLTEKAFLNVELFGREERVYKTGDLAKWLPDGNLEYLGRIDHQIKLRGFRIELGEIESAMLQFPGISECVVIARETGAGSGQLVAYAVSRDQSLSEIDPARQVKEYLKQKLPDYMVPAIVLFLEGLPLTANGKIDRKALPAPTVRKSSYVCARDTIELTLVRLWEQLFDISPISVQDDFFDIGGDSLLAMRLIYHIKKEFDRTLPLHTLFQNRTLEQLAAVLRQETPVSAWQPMICLQSEGDKTPIFFAHASGGSAFNALEFSSFMGKDRPFYAIHPRGAELGDPFHDSIEEMAADYVTAMREIQPEGPYLMAGWSFGGTVIFEMARLLEQAGETAPLLITIDMPEPEAVVWKEDDVEFLMDRLPHYHGVSVDELDENSSDEEKVTYLLKEIKVAGLMRPDIDQHQAQHWFSMYKHHNRLVGLYKPSSPVQSKMLFYKPAERIPFDDQMGQALEKWPPFVLGGLEMQEAPGNHFNMVSPANTAILAGRIKAYLEERSI
ncbi:Amino acid adenylation domain-containing protein [Candidatus Electrothrix gigas]